FAYALTRVSYTLSLHDALPSSRGFERDILRGDQGEVAIYANGAWLGRANTVLTGLGDAITGFAREAAVRQAAFAGAAAQPPLHLVQRPLFNTREGYGSAL